MSVKVQTNTKESSNRNKNMWYELNNIQKIKYLNQVKQNINYVFTGMLCRMQLYKTNLLAWLKICLESQQNNTQQIFQNMLKPYDV